jgi:hypothetical protein
VKMICMQPPLDVHGIMKNRRCHCLCCRLQGGGEGWPHSLLAVIRMDSNDNFNGDCLRKKGVDKGKGEEELKDGFVFSCCLILLLFFGLPFSMQVD